MQYLNKWHETYTSLHYGACVYISYARKSGVVIGLAQLQTVGREGIVTKVIVQCDDGIRFEHYEHIEITQHAQAA